MTKFASAPRRWRNPGRWDGGPFTPHRETFGWNVPVPSASATAIRDALWARVDATGAVLVRADCDWSRLQPTNPTGAAAGMNDALDATYLADLDAFVDDAAAHGIGVWFNLAYTPAWARPGYTTLPGYVTWGSVYHVPPMREPENGYPDYANVAWLVADRYAVRQRRTVVAIGLWNEPNIADFWLQPPGTGTRPSVDYTPDAGRYAQLIRGGYDAVKTGVVAARPGRAPHPEVTVTVGATAPATGAGNGTDYGPLEYLTEWIAYGDGLAVSAFDALDHHPYAWQWGPTYSADWNSFQQMHGLRDALVDAGRSDVLIWMSELGSVTRPDESMTDSSSPFGVGGYDTGPVPAGGWVTSSVAIDYTLGAQRVRDYASAIRDASWYDLSALKHVLGPSCWYGLNDTLGGIRTAWAPGAWNGYFGAYEYGTNGYDGPEKDSIVTGANGWRVLFAPDVTPPIGAVAAPEDGATIGGSVTVTIAALDDRDAVIERVVVLIDGAVIARAIPAGVGMYTATFDSATIPNGTRLISAEMTDVTGNVGVTPSVGVTFDNASAPAPDRVPQPTRPVAVVTETPPFTTDEIIDLVPGVGRVAMSTVYEVVSRSYASLGTLRPTAGKPQITAASERAVVRTLRQVEFAESDLAEINPLTDLLQPWAVYETGDRIPLGVFMFADASRNPRSAFVERTTTFYDLGLVLDQPIERSLTIRPGDSLMDVWRNLAIECGIPDDMIHQDGRAATPGAPMSWPAGTSRYEIMRTISATIACYPPHFNAEGMLVCRQVVDLIDVTPDRTYNYGGRILDGTLTITDTSYDAPNRYIVTGGSGANEVAAYFDVPADAPHSIANRGFVIAESMNLPGVSSYAQAYAAAIAAYVRDVRSWTVCQFSSTPDPRHAIYDVLDVLGETYVETGWTYDCSPGGEMQHQGSRVWLP